MKLKAAAFCAVALVSGTADPVLAQYLRDYGAYDQERAFEILPPREISAILRSMDFEPLHRPVWTGAHYVVRALTAGDQTVRILVEGTRGRILSITRVSLDGASGFEGNGRVGTLPPNFDSEMTPVPRRSAPDLQDGERWTTLPQVLPPPRYRTYSDYGNAPDVRSVEPVAPRAAPATRPDTSRSTMVAPGDRTVQPPRVGPTVKRPAGARSATATPANPPLPRPRPEGQATASVPPPAAPIEAVPATPTPPNATESKVAPSFPPVAPLD